MPGIKSRYQVTRVTGEGEETAGVAGVPLGVVHDLPFVCVSFTPAGAERGEGREKVPQKGL